MGRAQDTETDGGGRQNPSCFTGVHQTPGRVPAHCRGPLYHLEQGMFQDKQQGRAGDQGEERGGATRQG